MPVWDHLKGARCRQSRQALAASNGGEALCDAVTEWCKVRDIKRPDAVVLEELRRSHRYAKIWDLRAALANARAKLGIPAPARPPPAPVRPPQPSLRPPRASSTPARARAAKLLKRRDKAVNMYAKALAEAEPGRYRGKPQRAEQAADRMVDRHWPRGASALSSFQKRKVVDCLQELRARAQEK